MLLICGGTFVSGVLFGQSLRRVCLDPDAPLWQLAYRVFTAAVFHLGLLHIVFNAITWLEFASPLERRVGTTTFLYLTVLFMVAGGVLHVALARSVTALATQLLPAASEASRGPLLALIGWGRGCAVGLSGVLFSLLVVEASNHAADEILLVLGLVPCPVRLYPVVLLVLLQLLLPAVSFYGHLGGLLAGFVYVRGWLPHGIRRPLSAECSRRADETVSRYVPGWARREGEHVWSSVTSESGANRRSQWRQTSGAEGTGVPRGSWLSRVRDTLQTFVVARREPETADDANVSYPGGHRLGSAAEAQAVVMEVEDEEEESSEELMIRLGYPVEDAMNALAECDGDVDMARAVIDSRLASELCEMGFEERDVEFALQSGTEKAVPALVEWIAGANHSERA
ncbi:hypothetical protein CDCA_CDCA18G4523 [Cyanidium caldarium]|uniref:Peptidase S54 rhomboid domain-containing protein n=1 Tax=Cyanidium caldarium TaxID=2771 RepID=A0AAV9J1L5_CYACA|nr:hypothetical protein CDCA_CDCA18G4523 [Cyanidium caldarium]